MKARIFADFNNCDKKGRVRLNTNGSISDLKRKNIVLQVGRRILLDDEDGLRSEGVLEYSVEEQIWVAVVDWEKLKSQ
jgi:hypothetical protein